MIDGLIKTFIEMSYQMRFRRSWFLHQYLLHSLLIFRGLQAVNETML